MDDLFKEGAVKEVVKKEVKEKVVRTKPVVRKVGKRAEVSTGEVRIDKGIPLPTPRQKYPFDKMKVGESFFSVKSSVLNLSSKHNKGGKAKFTCKKVKGGYRVWRRV